MRVWALNKFWVYANIQSITLRMLKHGILTQSFPFFLDRKENCFIIHDMNITSLVGLFVA